MSNLLPISGASFRDRLQGRPLTDIDATDKPRLFWIAIPQLRVDPRYQRRISGRASEKNVIQIAAEFSWSKFAPVVVAEAEDGIFVIVDGQHRTTAAALRGIRDVPCLIVRADLADQAKAFAAINGNVTAISPMQLHAARVTAADPDALALQDACAEAGVTICRYPVAMRDMKTGETLAPAKLASQLYRYGRDVLVPALKCITMTGNGNVGMVRAPIVEALCAVLDGEPAWRRDHDALIAAMHSFDFHTAFTTARVRAASEGGGAVIGLIGIIGDHLETVLGAVT